MRSTSCLALLLVAASLAAPPALAAAAPDAHDLAVCAFLAGLESRETAGYLVKAAIFDLDGDGSPERLGIEDQGTMHIDHYLVARPGGDDVTISEPAVEDDDWGWNVSERWLIHSGRAYVLRFAGYDTGYLRFVSRIGADLVEHPLCKFQPQTDIALDRGLRPTTRSARRSPRTASEYAAVERFAEPREAPGHDIVAGRAMVTGKLTIDFANDRRPAEAYLYEVESSAGAGCTLKYYDSAPKDLRSPRHLLLAAMQGLDLDDAYSRRTCADAEPRWFTFANKRYLETQSTAADAPASERDEYHFVDVIEHGKPRHACAASYAHKPPKLAGVWDGTAFAAPAAEPAPAK